MAGDTRLASLCAYTMVLLCPERDRAISPQENGDVDEMSTRDDADQVLGDLTAAIEKSTIEIEGLYDWSTFSTDTLDQLAFQYAVTVRDFLDPYMRNQSKLKAEMGQKIRVKGTDNTTYVVDYVGGQVLDLLLQRWMQAGNAGGWSKFDEEDEQFIHIGDEPRKKIITDPFDNTTFGMVGYRDCNVAVCIADENNKFVNCAVADLQTDAVYFANNCGSWLYYVADHKIQKHYELKTASKTDLAGSYLITPHFKKERRIAFSRVPLFSEKVQTFNMGGPLCICRLAEGRDNQIHGYLDFVEEKKGQPIYEIVYFAIAIKAGACVTDMDGNEFDFEALVARLEQDPKARYRFVAACTPELHEAIMAKVTG